MTSIGNPHDLSSARCKLFSVLAQRQDVPDSSRAFQYTKRGLSRRRIILNAQPGSPPHSRTFPIRPPINAWRPNIVLHDGNDGAQARYRHISSNISFTYTHPAAASRTHPRSPDPARGLNVRPSSCGAVLR